MDPTLRSADPLCAGYGGAARPERNEKAAERRTQKSHPHPRRCVNLLGRVQGEVVLPGQNEELSLNGTDSIATMLPEVGYPYVVEFEINPDKDQNINGILFKGPHSTVYANWENKGKLAFSRDGYTFVFHAATLPAGAWTKVRIEGDHKGTTLYINGEKAERLEGRVKQFYNYTHKRKDKEFEC